MDQDRFRLETRALARPRLNLRAARGRAQRVGVWGGTGILPPPRGNCRHWITVRCDWLQGQGFKLSGWLGVYEDLDRDRFVLVQAPEQDLPLGGAKGTALTSSEDMCLPPVEALALYGSEEMRRCLHEASSSSPVLTYEEYCPLYYAKSEGIYAMLGGWHVPWPENNSYDEEQGRLVLWTFEGAEPWLEVWQRPRGKLQVIPRIT